MDSHLTARRLFLARLFFLAAAAATIETLDHTGATTIREAPNDGLDIFRPDGSRAGYGIHRRDGSIDLFRPDGSRLGYIQPASPLPDLAPAGSFSIQTAADRGETIPSIDSDRDSHL